MYRVSSCLSLMPCLSSVPWPSPWYYPLQVAEIQVEMELRDEILPRAQNIQSRLDQKTIETEEA